jgi:hypothetical protein
MVSVTEAASAANRSKIICFERAWKRPLGIHPGEDKLSPQETLISIAKTDLPLQGKLDAFKTEFETRLAPPSVVDVLHRATDELVASGAQANALKVGDKAPDFALPDADGNTVFSKTLLAKGPLVLTFFRGAI